MKIQNSVEELKEFSTLIEEYAQKKQLETHKNDLMAFNDKIENLKLMRLKLRKVLTIKLLKTFLKVIF